MTGKPSRPVRREAVRKGPAQRAPRRAADPTRTVRQQFLVEITGDPDDPSRHCVADLGELNRLFTAWVETVYHRQIHSETGQAPLARWTAGGPFALPTPGALAEAFLWASTARSPRPRWSRCRATLIRSTHASSGAESSWCSTRST